MDALDWTLTRSFLAVAETGSLSAAARKLGLSQPTLGRHIADLEATLGFALFSRQPRGLAPTPAAASLIPHAMAMRDAAARLTLAAAGQDVALDGTVRVTASRLIAAHVLPALIADLRQTHPGIQIEVVPSDTSENLLYREADIALRMYRPTQGEVITRHLMDVEVGFYAATAYLDRRGRPQRAEDLLDHDIAGYDRQDAYIRGFAEYGLQRRREDFPLRCDDSVVLWAMVRAGCGIGIVNVLIAEDDPAVERILPDLTLPALPLWLTAAEALRHTPRIRAVFDHLARGLLRLARPTPSPPRRLDHGPAIG